MKLYCFCVHLKADLKLGKSGYKFRDKLLQRRAARFYWDGTLCLFIWKLVGTAAGGNLGSQGFKGVPVVAAVHGDAGIDYRQRSGVFDGNFDVVRVKRAADIDDEGGFRGADEFGASRTVSAYEGRDCRATGRRSLSGMTCG